MTAGTDATLLPLLGSDEPPPFELLNADGQGDVVLVCDHASSRIPQRLGNLGLDTVQLASHIAWDPGAAAVARLLSEQLHAPLVMTGYSRLIIDCNRPLASAESIAEQSAGIAVPGNRDLTPAQRQQRIDALFAPYHAAIERLLESRAGRTRLLLSIHSFTPHWHGEPRPWAIGISGWHQRQLESKLIETLAMSGKYQVGDNQPYPIEDDIDYTLPVHSDAHRIPGIMVEIRQDGIATEAGVATWAQRIADVCRSIGMA